MERVVVTGCAGFLGSHLCEQLLAGGTEVVGIDCFTDYYARDLKERNLVELREHPRFTLLEIDLSSARLDGLLEGVDVVFHLAAQAGVRGSFGETFATYLRNNVQATQRLLEAAAQQQLPRVVYASSSSVYGDAERRPTPESTPRQPVSPYGMTKVATEELAGVYGRTRGVDAIGLRYFTAYGPRQRPDMAFTRFLTRSLKHEPLIVFGDGRQVRDFTYVDDVVAGTIAAAERGTAGAVYNIGGGTPVELLEVFELIGELLERPVDVEHRESVLGDARATGSSTELAAADLGYAPQVDLASGLAAQLEWLRELLAETGVPVRDRARVSLSSRA
ncbi:MAG: NAD-dependent epimerase/dehydratase family protein [Actinobacteria bacterium]|nr:NAD-dependent epimerase/dehydratase family protein [Actinomycetota bacterium]